MISGLVSFSYIPLGFKRFRLSSNNISAIKKTNYEWIMAGVLVTLGLVNILSEYLKHNSNKKRFRYITDIKQHWGTSIIAGITAGLILSTVGRFAFNFSTDLFGFKGNFIHLYAIILYSLIFTFIISPLTSYTLSVI